MLLEGLKINENLEKIHAYSQLPNINNNVHESSPITSKFKLELEKIVEAQEKTKKHTEKFLIDHHGQSLHNIMLDIEKASLSIQLAVQIRNKLLSAYQDIMDLQL